MMSLRKSSLIVATSAVAIMTAAPAAVAADKLGMTPVKAEVKLNSQVKADTLVGKDLKNTAGETIGEVDSVIIDKSGKVAAVVVGVGGFLGMGERDVAVDWNDLQIGRSDSEIRTSMSKAELKALPEYKYEKPEYRKRAFRDARYADHRHDMRDARSTTMDQKARSTTMGDKADWVAAKGLRVSKLVGADVVNGQGETIGKVEDLVMVDGQTKLILSVGAFLGMGGHNVALDLDKAKIDRERGDVDDLRVSVAMNKEQLKAMPKFDLDAWTESKKRS